MEKNAVKTFIEAEIVDWNTIMDAWEYVYRKHLWRIKSSDKEAKFLIKKMQKYLVDPKPEECIRWLSKAIEYCGLMEN